MASELCMKCFHVKGKYDICPLCGYAEGTPPDQPHYLMPGTILGGHFLVGTAIGAGGFGITYRCFDVTLGVVVAAKEFYPAGLVNRAPGQAAVGLLSGDKRSQYRAQLSRFLMEAQSIAQFGKAKDIVNVYDFFEENNTAYIIMEYVDGILLKDYLEKQGRVVPEDALSIIAPIIEAVKKIHGEGIIHRDISPDNIFISGSDSVKVFDFGAAQLNDSSAGLAAEKVIKVGYSAPEQYRDKYKQGFFTDIYSVGAILYQMLTGIKPIESTEREFKDELKSPLELGVKVEPNIDRAVMEALAVKPELRFQNIQHFEDALQSKRIAEYPKQKLRKRKRKRNWIISLAVAVVLGICVFIGLMNTVLREEQVIFDQLLKKEETPIVVWVDSQEARKKLEDIVEKDFFPSQDTAAGNKKLKEMLRDNEKNLKESGIQVVDVTEGDSGGTMETKLAEAKASGNMPDMFLSDRVRNLDEYSLISLKEDVYDAIDDLDQYLYFDTYPKYCRDMKEIPTGINGMFLYGIHFEDNKKNTFDSSKFYVDSPAPTVELQDIMDRNGVQNRKEFTMVEDGFSTKAGILSNSSCFLPQSGTLAPDSDLVSSLYYFAAQMRGETVNKRKAVKGGTGKDVPGNSVIAGVEYRKGLNEWRNGVQRGGITANEVSDYSVQVVTKDGQMLVTYEDKFAVSAESSRNRQIACMRLLRICLLKSAQTKNYPSDLSTPFPILKSAFDEFFEYNKEHKCFQKMIGSPTYLIGDGLAELKGFDDGVCGLADKNAMQYENILAYCEKYVENKKKETQVED